MKTTLLATALIIATAASGANAMDKMDGKMMMNMKKQSMNCMMSDGSSKMMMMSECSTAGGMVKASDMEMMMKNGGMMKDGMMKDNMMMKDDGMMMKK